MSVEIIDEFDKKEDSIINKESPLIEYSTEEDGDVFGIYYPPRKTYYNNPWDIGWTCWTCNGCEGVESYSGEPSQYKANITQKDHVLKSIKHRIWELECKVEGLQDIPVTDNKHMSIKEINVYIISEGPFTLKYKSLYGTHYTTFECYCGKLLSYGGSSDKYNVKIERSIKQHIRDEFDKKSKDIVCCKKMKYRVGFQMHQKFELNKIINQLLKDVNELKLKSKKECLKK